LLLLLLLLLLLALLLLLLLALVAGAGAAVHGLSDLHGGVLGAVDGLAHLLGVIVGEALVLVQVLEGVQLALDLLHLGLVQLRPEFVELLLSVEESVLRLVSEVDELLR
jgi:hypothetical protein